jgi:hypothetical protein
MELLKTIYNKVVLRILRAIGFVNSLILLTLFYYLILGPVALIRFFFRCSSSVGGEKCKSYWIKRKDSENSIESMKVQF